MSMQPNLKASFVGWFDVPYDEIGCVLLVFYASELVCFLSLNLIVLFAVPVFLVFLFLQKEDMYGLHGLSWLCFVYSLVTLKWTLVLRFWTCRAPRRVYNCTWFSGAYHLTAIITCCWSSTSTKRLALWINWKHVLLSWSSSYRFSAFSI